MSLQVIGAGWGRTGTESLKLALEQLGFGKCYHMFELIKDNSRFPFWLQLERDERPDYDKLFEGYRSAVDFPAALYYREFMQQYPDAKVILTVRDPDQWYSSASNTILKGIPSPLIFIGRVFGFLSPKLKALPKSNQWLKRILYGESGLFQGKKEDRQWMMQRFMAWNEEVKKTVPAEKLLVFNVKEGWEPLCRFLNLPVPQTPFPRANTGENFKQKSRQMLMKGKE